MFASFKFYVPLAGLSFAIGPLFYSKVSCDSDAANGKNTGLFYEKGTGMHVPTKLVLQNQYKLLSAAARKVTFLKFSVYSIGIYVTENDDAKSFNTCSDAVSKQSLALRLAPSRATTGTHMRAGLERALLQQLQLQLPKDTSEIDRCRDSIAALKASIPRGDIYPGDVLVFEKSLQNPDVLEVYFQVGDID